MGFDYIPLEDAEVDIRLASLLPGDHSDAIQLVLTHTPLRAHADVAATHVSQQHTISGIQESLPKNWVVAETLEGRLLFEHEPTEKTSWEHPDPMWQDYNLYERVRLPPPDFEPRYEALSYLWGSSENPCMVQVAQPDSTHALVSGTDRSMYEWATMSVGQNLDAALRHLRLPESTRTLWIDAICINQDDREEKSKQIVRMSALYRMATRVVVWLGPNSELQKSTLAMKTLDHLGRQLELDCSTVRFASPTATEPTWFRAVSPLPYSESMWFAIERLLSRPYFERLWVMQEVLLANSKTLVVCGRDEVAWYYFIRAIVCLLAKDTLSSDLRRALEFVRALTWRFDQLSVPFLLNLGRQRKCHLIKDRIYGILGVAPLGFSQSIKPNYHLEDSTVFVQACVACMKYDNRLTLLQDCELSFSSSVSSSFPSSQRPSWVPDWSSPRQTRPLSAFVFSSGASRACSTLAGPNLLEVRGSRLATLTGALEPQNLVTGRYVSGGSLLDAFLTVLRLGYLDERWPRYSLPTLADWRQYYLDKLHSINGVPHENEIENHDVYLCTSFLKGRTLVTTETGHIGLAPAGARQGDAVFTILGCKSSILLRRCGDGERWYVVGECYIHGLDDAIGLLGELPNAWRVQITKDHSGHAQYSYLNSETGLTTQMDPRLGPLPPAWVPSNSPRQAGMPALRSCYKNIETGEVMDSDPRLLPEALENRGVVLENLLLS
ncbi:HET-domain-containing protein [Apiospora sp. TS-2023a]